MPVPHLTTVADLVEAVNAVAPFSAAEPWDNVGLILGDPDAPLTGVLCCIDLTSDVVREAMLAGATAVVAYHPPLFKDVRRLCAGQPAFDAVRAGLAVVSPHTAFDVANGGTNDVLAEVLGLTHTRPLRPRPVFPQDIFKLVTFVPPADVAAVADALFAAGAGHIGGYDRCSFRTPGTGTFRGGTGTNPSVGTAGRDEYVDEMRLEVVVPQDMLDAAVAALRRAHPYEEVAVDLLPLRRSDATSVGLGRIGEFAEPVPRQVLFDRVRQAVGMKHLLVAGPAEGDVTQAAVCGGSCGDLLADATRQGATFYLTGELRHHDALAAARRGVTVCCVLHSNSERLGLRRLAEVLAGRLAGVPVTVSARDRDPFSII